MAKKLLVFLTILVVCVALFVACGETPATSTVATSTDSGNQTPDSGSSTQTTTTQAPVSTETPVSTDPDYTGMNAVEIFQVQNDAIWCGPIHAGVVFAPRVDKDNAALTHENAFRFGYAADEGIFGDDPDLLIPGIQFTDPVCAFIKNVNDEDYTKYEIEYYETPNWWEVWFVVKDFTPVDGESYLIALFIESDNSLAHTYPESILFWETYEDEAWTYEAPAPVVSKYGEITDFVEDIKDRTQLYYHDTLTIDAEGKLRYTFKSDNTPFAQVGDTMGLTFTSAGKVFINGLEYQIVDESYVTEEHYIINFQIKDFKPVVGTTYEILFTVEADDETGDYCMDLDGYFALNDYTHTAAAGA